MPYKDPEEKKENSRKNYLSRKSLEKNWYQKYPEKIKNSNKKYHKNWYEKNKMKKKEYCLSWRKANPEKVLSCHLKYKFNITKDQYDLMLKEQQGKCKICGKVMIEILVDHCHKTNKIRGLLCRKCNSILGYATDDISILKSALRYLEESDL